MAAGSFSRPRRRSPTLTIFVNGESEFISKANIAGLLELCESNVFLFIFAISIIRPCLSANRTVKARVEVNPGFKLKPNMYVDTYISKKLGEQLVVPKSAIIDTGEKRIVFVKTGEGSFLPTEVEIGSELDIKESDLSIERRYQVITSGLTEDDSVVTEGNFLLDSESNLQSAMNQMVGGHNH